MAEQAALDLLRRLARDFNVRDARKLYQIAKFPNQPAVTVNRAREALRGDVARQVLAPKPHADLIDFSQNTRSAKKYGLVVTDVFTREAVTRALRTRTQRRWHGRPRRRFKIRHFCHFGFVTFIFARLRACRARRKSDKSDGFSRSCRISGE